jgi:hypothetical protein
LTVAERGKVSESQGRWFGASTAVIRAGCSKTRTGGHLITDRLFGPGCRYLPLYTSVFRYFRPESLISVTTLAFGPRRAAT